MKNKFLVFTFVIVAVVSTSLSALDLIQVASYKLEDNWANAVFFPDGERVLISFINRKQNIVWNTITNSIETIFDTKENVEREILDPTGQIIFTQEGLDGRLRAYSTRDGQIISDLANPIENTWIGQQLGPFSPDGNNILLFKTRNNSTGISVINIYGEEVYQTLPGAVSDAKFRVDDQGQLQVVSIHLGRIKVWDVATGTLLQDIPGLHNRVNLKTLAISKDGSMAAVASTHSLHIFDLKREDLSNSFHLKIDLRIASANYKPELDFSPDNSTLLAYNSNSSIYVYDTETGELKFIIPRNKYSAARNSSHDVKFTPDGSYIATLERGYVSKIIFWDAQSGKRKFSFYIPGEETNSMSFNSEGNKVVLTYQNSPWVRVFHLPPKRLLGDEVLSLQETALIKIIEQYIENAVENKDVISFENFLNQLGDYRHLVTQVMSQYEDLASYLKSWLNSEEMIQPTAKERAIKFIKRLLNY